MLGIPSGRVLRRAVAMPLVLALVAGPLPGAVGAQGPPHAPDELLVGIRAGVDDARADDVLRGHGAARLEKIRGLRVHRVRVAPSALEAVERALARRPEVEFVERNIGLPEALVPNDPALGQQWHHDRIDSFRAWDTTTGSSTVIVAVIDSGVDASHPDLSGRLVPGYNFYDGNPNTADVTGHGTKVAGVAAAAGNNGEGVAGVAWRSRIMPLRTSSPSGVSAYSAVASAITWAADHGAKVVNMSIGGVAGSKTIVSAAQYAMNRGVVVVASAGNAGGWESTPETPYILSVSGTDKNDALAKWSSQGKYVDISAPGTSIYTTVQGGGYGTVAGTSVASPLVAGTAALVMTAKPALSAAQVVTLLEANADDLGPSGWDSSFGYGRLNARRAVAAAGGSVVPTDTTPPDVSVTSPASGATVSGSTTVSVSASDGGGVARVELHVDGALVASDATSPFSFLWDTTKVANGAHTLTAKAVDAAGNVGTSSGVTVTVSNGGDTVAPVVSITAMKKFFSSVRVGVSATDDTGVVRVELWVDGALYATSPTAPVDFKVRFSTLSKGTHSVQARAYDAAGNRGTSGTQSFVK